MRLWSLGFVIIALFAAIVAFADGPQAMAAIRTTLSVVIGLFVLWLLWDRFRDGQQD